MRQVFYIVVLFITTVFILNSCAPLYVPNVVNAPMLREKEELNVSGHLGISGFDAQGAYAVTDNFALMVNGSYLNSTSDSTSNYHKHIFVEAGIGYYKPIKKHFIFDVYGGYGIGKIHAFSTGLFSAYSNTYVNRFFVQPSFGFTSSYFEAAITPRSVVVFANDKTKPMTGFFIEPTLILKAGAPNLKFVAQLGLSFLINKYENDFDYQPFIVSIGLQYSLRGVETKSRNF
ncbi:MAG: hypothetical protein PHE33_12825 [Bacteroidales bacterium]|nr:hypothetical protein [Bacteroidales bacterium]